MPRAQLPLYQIDELDPVVAKPNRRKRPHRKARMTQTGRALKRRRPARIKRGLF